jgi:hypothetical protein
VVDGAIEDVEEDKPISRGAGTTCGKARNAPRGVRVTMAQKEGTIDEDGDAVVVEEADVEDDVVKPPWTRHAPCFPHLEMCRRLMHVLVFASTTHTR